MVSRRRGRGRGSLSTLVTPSPAPVNGGPRLRATARLASGRPAGRLLSLPPEPLSPFPEEAMMTLKEFKRLKNWTVLRRQGEEQEHVINIDIAGNVYITHTVGARGGGGPKRVITDY